MKYGGLPFWSYFIDYFYEKVTRDPMLRSVFAGRDMRCIKEMQLSLLALTLTCGNYTDEGVRMAHERLGVLETSFQRFMTLYQKALEDMGVEKEDITFMLNILEAYRGQVISSD